VEKLILVCVGRRSGGVEKTKRKEGEEVSESEGAKSAASVSSKIFQMPSFLFFSLAGLSLVDVSLVELNSILSLSLSCRLELGRKLESDRNQRRCEKGP
jgi:hypothetical protein